MDVLHDMRTAMGCWCVGALIAGEIVPWMPVNQTSVTCERLHIASLMMSVQQSCRDDEWMCYPCR